MMHAVFFDRDGIVNQRLVGGYVTTWTDFRFLPDIFTVLPPLHSQGWLLILVTNQRGIALGRMTIADLDAIHEHMQTELKQRCGVSFDDVFVCPHTNEDDCDCRKPKAGLLLRAIAAHKIDAGHSWMIGDSETDVVAGNRAGCRSILVGHEPHTVATYQCDTLIDAANIIVDEASQETR